MQKLILSILIALLPTLAMANPKLLTSVAINKINVVDENLKVPSEINYSFSYGFINATKSGFTYSLSTNRGIEIENKTNVQINANQKFAQLKTKITSDVFSLGYNNKRSIYSLNLMNVQKISKLGNTKQEKHAIMYGLSYSYALSKKIIVTATAIAPNHGMGVRAGGILTVGYIW